MTAIQNGLISLDPSPGTAVVPCPAPHPVIDRDRHLVLVGSARLNGGRFDDANLARRRARGIDVRFPNLGAAGAKRKIVRTRIHRIIAKNQARRTDGRVLDHVQVAINLEALRSEAVYHGRDHEAVAVCVGDDVHAAESAIGPAPRMPASRHSQTHRDTPPSERWPRTQRVDCRRCCTRSPGAATPEKLRPRTSVELAPPR